MEKAPGLVLPLNGAEVDLAFIESNGSFENECMQFLWERRRSAIESWSSSTQRSYTQKHGYERTSKENDNEEEKTSDDDTSTASSTQSIIESNKNQFINSINLNTRKRFQHFNT